MIGAILNSCGILLGGTIGLASSKALSMRVEAQLRIVLASLTVIIGLRLTWLSLDGSAVQILKQCVVLFLALTLGKLTGKLFRLQKLSNHLGHRAHQHILSVQTSPVHTVNDGFQPCTVLFCAAPLGIVGAALEGLSSSRFFYPLAVKAIIDGFAAMGLVRVLGWGVLISAIPVFTFLGLLTLVSENLLASFLAAR